MKQKRIIISGYVGKKITGIGRNIISIIENNKSKDFLFIVYINKDMVEAFSSLKGLENVKLKTYNISKMSSIGNLLWTTFIFPWMALFEKASVAVIPNFTFLLFKFRPTVIIMHDLIEFNISDKFSKLKMFYRKKIADPISAKRANRILTVSINSQKDIIKFLKIDKSKIGVIKNGVDFNLFNECKQSNFIESKGLKKNKYLFYAGTVDYPGKNVFALIKAFELLKKDKKYDGKLVIAGMKGKGSEVVFEKIQNSSYKNDIIYLGYVTDEELTELYSNCSLFCFLSLYEGFGIPPLEALACGSRVLVSNTSSLPEVVGNVGVTCDPLNIQEIAEKIETICKNEITDDYKLKVKEHLQNFTWSSISDNFMREIELI